MNYRSNTITVFLIGICLIPTFVLLSLQIARYWVRFEMREAMEKQQLQELIIDKSAIHWLEEGKELIINGAYFDVAESKAINDDQIWIKGIFDYQEQLIEEQADSLLKHQSGELPILIKKVSAWQLFFYEHYPTINCSNSPVVIYYNTASQACIERYIEVHLPPPKHSFI